MNHLDINQIKDIIPHRHPFLLIDYIEDYVPGEYAVAYRTGKNILPDIFRESLLCREC